MNKRILISHPIKAERLKTLNNTHQVDCVSSVKSKYNEVLERIGSYDALHAISLKVDDHIIDAGKSLKIISNYGVGYDNIDVKYAASKGISVANTPLSTSKATAEYTIGLILSLLRKISVNDFKLKTNQLNDWTGTSQTGHSLSGKKLGILGMGRIGKHVALLAQAFGMQVVYYNRKKLSNTNLASYVSLDELFQSSDVLSIHAPSTTDTYHIVNKERLQLMKPSSWLINTSRGNLVDHAALIAVLEQKQLMGAALDVFPEEPNIPSALLMMDNVLLSPHNGTGTFEDRAAMFKESFDNILAFFRGDELSGKVC